MNLADETQSAAWHFFSVVLLIDSPDECCRYRDANARLRVFLCPFVANCGSGNEARARAPASTMIEI